MDTDMDSGSSTGAGNTDETATETMAAHGERQRERERPDITIFITRGTGHKDRLAPGGDGTIDLTWSGQKRKRDKDAYMRGRHQVRVFYRERSGPYFYVGKAAAIQQIDDRTKDSPPEYKLRVEPEDGGYVVCDDVEDTVDEKWGRTGRWQRACWKQVGLHTPPEQPRKGIYVHPV